jgi:hypothetical protein
MARTAASGRIASFHLVRERPGRALLAMGRLALDRPRLARVPGLVFWRLLGTGRGDDTGPSTDLRRTALFAVWDGDRALDEFLATSAISRRWSQADEVWSVRLRRAGGHGRWRGVDVLDRLEPATPGGPVAVLTRADVRPRVWVAFRRASRAVSAELQMADGLISAVGIGEAPLGRLGTFSLWRDIDAARHFASKVPRHRDVVLRTRAERWYSEELFATFEPYASSGSWDGRDPLA